MHQIAIHVPTSTSEELSASYLTPAAVRIRTNVLHGTRLLMALHLAAAEPHENNDAAS